MKAKALLLTAALAAVTAATATAQVFSVNAVGYVNVQLTPGFNLVSNPLQAADNSIGALFSNISPSIPAGMRVYAFNAATGAFHTPAQRRGAPFNDWSPAASAAIQVPVGEGAFVFDPRTAGSAPLTLTFVGEVRQGDLSNPIPSGFSIKANMVPQAGRPDTFGTFPAAGGDRFFKFNKATGGYNTHTRRGAPFNDWNPALPTIEVGEAFFYFRSGAPTAWTRTFNVNAS
jgi:hypothetical protein